MLFAEVAADLDELQKTTAGCAAVAGDHVYWVCTHNLGVVTESSALKATGTAYRAKRTPGPVAGLLIAEVSRKGAAGVCNGAECAFAELSYAGVDTKILVSFSFLNADLCWPIRHLCVNLGS